MNDHAPESTRPRLAVLTGEPRTGKTTVARRIVEIARARGLICGGFLSPDRRSSTGEKLGIELQSQWDDERRLLALVGRGLVGPLVGPYSFDQTAIDWGIDLFRASLASGCDLIAADELGRLEFEYGLGFAPLLADLAAGRYSRALVVGRLGLCEALLDLQPRVEVGIFRVDATAESRAEVSDATLAWLLCPEDERRPVDRGAYPVGSDGR